MEDIKVNSETLERVKVMGSKVTSDATSEEKLKVEKRLHALETRFYGLEKTAKGRMNELKVCVLPNCIYCTVLYILYCIGCS